MSFTPSSEQNRGSSSSNDGFNFVAPKAGARRARISLIVDLGTQKRPDVYKTADGKMANEDTPGAVGTPQKPAQQVAVFADLVSDTVDYGGSIGKAHYRLMLNKSFKGVLSGITFQKSPPKDAKGKDIPGKPWAIHPQNLLTKLAIAVGKPEIAESADISLLLNEQFMATVEVKETDSGKKNAEDEPIIYRNVNFKGASQVPAEIKEDENGDEVEVVPTFAALKTPAMCITFTNAKKEDIKYLRKSIINQIKLADNYAGSNMQKAIEAFEAEGKEGTNDEAGDDDEAPKEQPKPKTAKPAAKPAPKAKAAPDFSDMDDDIPFMYGCRLGKEDQFRGPRAVFL